MPDGHAALERRFRNRCLDGAELLRQLLGRPRTEFLRMIGEHGAVDATRRLIHAGDTSETFKVLWGRKELHLTMEAIVVNEPDWDPLFDDEDRRAAYRRLVLHEYRPLRDFRSP